MTAANTYDDIVYHTRPRRVTHVDSMATLGTLLGMTPAPITACRVLELGCGTGGNLTPMAATLPGSRFVGVDLSSVQIDLAKQTVSQLGLSNIEYRAESLMNIGEADGKFDYIIAHGLYSWVPPEVQQKVLEICSRNLTPNGIAYISFNTLPGWHLRSQVRAMTNWHTRDVQEPRDKVKAARSFLAFLKNAVPYPDSPYHQLIDAEEDHISRESDHYVYHEYLEADNEPVYFHEFMRRAGAVGLQYLGEGEERRRTHELPEQVRQAIDAASTNIVELEQYYDFLWNRPFRRSLLCHQNVPLDRSTKPETLETMLVSGLVRPTNPNPDLTSGVVEEFETMEGTKMSTDAVLVKTFLNTLYRIWPKAMPVQELQRRMAEQVGEAWAAEPERAKLMLAKAVLEFYLTGITGLNTHLPAFVTDPGPKPTALPLARLQASRQALVTSARHQEVQIEPLDRLVLPLLDGTRDRAALAAAIQAELDRGMIRFTNEADANEALPSAEELLEASLDRISRCALMTA